MAEEELTGLILTGGGARAAYQVGVLKGIAQIRREAGQGRGPSPLKVIAGTSAGAINATALACGADNFDYVVAQLVKVWSQFQAAQVYRADTPGVMRSAARWLSMLSMGWLLARWHMGGGFPRSLLDNSPLQELLQRLVPLQRLPELMEAGHVHALAVTAFSYSSGQHVTFYESRDDIQPWMRSQRIAVHDSITHTHLLASSAIPFVFPAVRLLQAGAPEYFGDGSIRQVAPVSPAIHLGARRLLIIGAGRIYEPPGQRRIEGYPSLAQIAGHTLSNIFLDALAVDVERMRRINNTLGLMSPNMLEKTALRPVELLVIAPSERLDDIAGRHINALPRPIRILLGGLGVRGNEGHARGSVLASYLLFEAPYTRELIDLGVADTLKRRTDVEAFFGWQRLPVSP